MANLLQPPIWRQLDACTNIVIAGCGGGYDVYQGVPLYFTLRDQGKNVHLANLTFVNDVHLDKVKQPIAGLWEVTADSTVSGRYCPEAHLCQYLRERHQLEAMVYTIARQGYRVVKDAYQYIVGATQADAILLVDGGSDSLMAGDEEGLATIEEDHISMLAVNDVESDLLQLRVLVVLGMGVDRFHGCSDAASLRAVAEITMRDGMLGMQMLQTSMAPVVYYQEAVNYANEHSSNPSIVGSTVLSAIEGHYGNYHSNPRTGRSALYINAMMAMLWFFDLSVVVARINSTLAGRLRLTSTRELERDTVAEAIEGVRRTMGATGEIRSVEELPRTYDFKNVVAPGI